MSAISQIPTFPPSSSRRGAVKKPLTFDSVLKIILRTPHSQSLDPRSVQVAKMLHDWIFKRVNSDYHDPELNAIMRLYQNLYLIKNSNGETEAQVSLGRSISVSHFMEDQLYYYREYNNVILDNLERFMRKDLKSQAIPNNCRFCVVYGKEIKNLLQLIGVIHDSTEDLKQLINDLSTQDPSQLKPRYYFIKPVGKQSKSLAKRIKAAYVELEIKHRVLLGNGFRMGPCANKAFTLISLQKIDENQDLYLMMLKGNTKNIDVFIRTGVYTPTITSSFKYMDSTIPLTRVRQTNYPCERGKELSIDQFLNLNHVQAYFFQGSDFCKIRQRYPRLPELLSSANSRFILELSSPLYRLDKKTDPEKFDIASLSLDRLQTLIHYSLMYEDNHNKFCFIHELIAEEILLLLNLTKPYHEGSFQEIISTKRCYMKIPPLAIPFTSGMAACGAILQAICRFTGSSAPNIAITDNSYYEIKNGLLTYDTYDASHLVENCHILNMENLSIFLEKLSQNSFKPNVVFAEIRSIPSVDMNEGNTTKKALNNFLIELIPHYTPCNPLTVALDVTNDKMHSREIHELINDFSDYISSQILNIVVYRSSHKFDQLGVDKINAGYLELYSTNYNLQRCFQKVKTRLSGLDYQALCHFLNCADEEIHQFAKLHYRNRNILYDEISVLKSSTDGLSVMTNSDRKSYYVQIVANSKFFKKIDDLNVIVCTAISVLCVKEGIAAYARDSFGFNDTTICVIQPSLRLSVGTHPVDQIHKLARILFAIDHAIKEFSENYEIQSSKRHKGNGSSSVELIDEEDVFDLLNRKLQNITI